MNVENTSAQAGLGSEQRRKDGGGQPLSAHGNLMKNDEVDKLFICLLKVVLVLLE